LNGLNSIGLFVTVFLFYILWESLRKPHKQNKDG